MMIVLAGLQRSVELKKMDSRVQGRQEIHLAGSTKYICTLNVAVNA